MCISKKKIQFDDYGKTVVSLRGVRSELKKQFEAMHNEVLDVLRLIDSGKGGNIPFYKIQEMPLNEWISYKKIDSMKIYDNHGIVKVVCNIGLNGLVLWHRHDDCVEEIKVVKGRLLDRLTGQKFIANDKIIYKAKEEHELEALEDTILEVKFIKV